MICKNLLALVVWCHCYQIVLNPFLHILASSLYYSPFGFSEIIMNRYEQQKSSGHLNHNNLLNINNNNYLLVTGTPIIVEAEQVVLIPGHELTLQCNSTDYPDTQFSWHRIRKSPNSHHREYEEEEMKNKEDRYIVQNNVLILKSPNFNDVADYICRVKNPTTDMEKEKRIIVRARPYIMDFELESSTYRSATVEEDQYLEIVCNVVDDYTPASNINIKWTMSRFEDAITDDIYEDSPNDGVRIKTYNTTSQALIIDRVNKGHRKFYKCHADNGITTNEKIILLRVKNKYTVIWPSLGILFEFIILLVVICIVENRRVEPDKEVYDHKAAHM